MDEKLVVWSGLELRKVKIGNFLEVKGLEWKDGEIRAESSSIEYGGSEHCAD